MCKITSTIRICVLTICVGIIVIGSVTSLKHFNLSDRKWIDGDTGSTYVTKRTGQALYTIYDAHGEECGSIVNTNKNYIHVVNITKPRIKSFNVIIDTGCYPDIYTQFIKYDGLI